MVKIKLAWKWIKKNWKLLLGAAIPITISILLRKGNAKQIWKHMSESKDKEIDMKENVNKVGNEMREQAWKDLQKDQEDLSDFQKRRLDQIETERLADKESIDTAEKATQAIKDKLEK